MRNGVITYEETSGDSDFFFSNWKILHQRRGFAPRLISPKLFFVISYASCLLPGPVGLRQDPFLGENSFS